MQDIEIRFEEDKAGNLTVVFERAAASKAPSAGAALVLVDQGDSFAARWVEPAAASA